MEEDRGMTEEKAVKNWVGIGISVLQFVASAIFIVLLIQLNMLPDSYLVLIIGGILLLGFASIYWQIKIEKLKLVGKIISGILIVVLIIGSVYIYQINSALQQITSVSIKLENMVVSVRIDDLAEDIVDAQDYIFAVQGSVDTEELDGLDGYVQTIVDEIEGALESEIAVVEYETLGEQIAALQNNEVQAIIYNEAYLTILEDDYPEFDESIKVIFEHGIEVELEETEEVELESDAFVVYISGIDIYGSITKTSRSDVNILAVVNPDTEQILLVTTPRDYYVTLPGVTGDSEDKLTHAGIYGVDVSMGTLEALYDTEIDFYARVNFTSLINMVDALGGITVYSNQSFQTTKHDGVSYYVEEGYNEFSGIEALYFARERLNISGGDYQRGENQEEIIKAMIEKVTSPAIITGAYEILESVADNIDTNMSMDQMQELIKTQIDEGTEWEIVMVAAEGVSGSAVCYSYPGENLSVSYPVEDSVNEISALIESVLNNEVIGTEEDIEEEIEE